MGRANKRPSGSFGTRLNEEAYFVSPEQQRAAVLTVCYAAGTTDKYGTALPISDVALVLEALGLDPRIGKVRASSTTKEAIQEVEKTSSKIKT